MGSQLCVYVQYVSSSFQQSAGNGVGPERGTVVSCVFEIWRSGNDDVAMSRGRQLVPLVQDVYPDQRMLI